MRIVGRSLVGGALVLALLSPTACDRATPATSADAGALFGAFVQPGPTTGAPR